MGRIAEACFATEERRAIDAMPPEDQLAGFLTCWVRREAYLKARGDGLAGPLVRFAVTAAPVSAPRLLRVEGSPEEAGTWSVLDVETGSGYVGAVAIRTRPDGPGRGGSGPSGRRDVEAVRPALARRNRSAGDPPARRRQYNGGSAAGRADPGHQGRRSRVHGPRTIAFRPGRDPATGPAERTPEPRLVRWRRYLQPWRATRPAGAVGAPPRSSSRSPARRARREPTRSNGRSPWSAATRRPTSASGTPRSAAGTPISRSWAIGSAIDLGSRAGLRWGEGPLAERGILDLGSVIGIGPFAIRRPGAGRRLGPDADALTIDPLVARLDGGASRRRRRGGAEAPAAEPCRQPDRAVADLPGPHRRPERVAGPRRDRADARALCVVDLLGRGGLTIDGVTVRSARLDPGLVLGVGRFRLALADRSPGPGLPALVAAPAAARGGPRRPVDDRGLEVAPALLMVIDQLGRNQQQMLQQFQVNDVEGLRPDRRAPGRGVRAGRRGAPAAPADRRRAQGARVADRPRARPGRRAGDGADRPSATARPSARGPRPDRPPTGRATR